ncbi:TrkH family potassium uptake protein [Neiella marina]|uniref:Trk system potassium uptake protein n=1 Tax=Neiella holothuriorum TaxID=2870530 RepID=A0ABS7EK98_9GAMM|nr:TrkH family potassium uptake protein [Neiella holothuriorum]MBW8192774.1 TrkH family potassium uptake protein [Neiella holothuriorum]
MLNLRLLILVQGLFLSKLALLMLVPVSVGWYFDDHSSFDFLIATGLTAALGGILAGIAKFRPTPLNSRLRPRDMFLLTTLIWLFMALVASVPLVLVEHISVTDAFFETISGLTTTGSTVLSDLANHSPAILAWRSLLQWAGGIGFIVMGVGILPYLNVGGMKLFQTESSDWSDKQIPHLKQYARLLFGAYCGLTLLCLLCYRLAGMSWFDAFNHSLTTLSTGGYSTSDSSMAAFPEACHWVGSLFMFVGGIPLLIFVQSIRRRSWRPWHDEQILGYAKLVLISSLMLAIHLSWAQQFNWLDAIRLSLFNTISVITTTGFALTDYSAWSQFAAMVFFILTFCGGCSGSTAGGIKIFRFQVAWRVMARHLRRLIHPHGTFVARYNQRVLDDDVITSVLTLLFLFVFTIVILALFLAVQGLDVMTSLTGAVTAVCNVGPGLGEIIGPAGNFASLPDPAKWALGFGMLAGRLEITTVVILLLPRFWAK